MDSHWSKFKVGAWADRLARAAAAASLLVLTFGPIPFQPSGDVTQAADLEWGGIRIPLQSAADTTSPFTDIATPGDNNTRTAVAPDGTIFVTRIDGASAAVWRSSDGGRMWQAANSTCVTGNLSIKVSPKYSSDSAVAVLCSGAGAVPGISLSRDGGATFGSGATAANNTLTGVTALSFDLAPNFNANEGGMVVVGTTGAAASVVLGNRWTAAGDFAAPYFAPNAPAITNSANADGVIEIAFSPKYSTDSTVIAIHCDNGTALVEGRVSLGTTNASTGGYNATAPTATLANAGGCTNASTVRTAFPTDVESGATTYFMIYNENNNGVSAGAWEDLQKRTGSTTAGTFTGMTPQALGTVAISARGLAAWGTFADAHIYVLQDAVNPQIFRSTNGGTSWKSGVQVDKDGGAVGSAGGNHDVALHPSYSTNNTLYVTSRGTRGGLHWSSNGGGSFADSGLTNGDFNNELVALEVVDTATMFLVTDSTAGGGSANRALWKTTTAGTGSQWSRVDRRDSTYDVKASPTFATDGAVYSIIAGVTTQQVMKSSDAGLSFKETTSDPSDKNVVSLAVASGSTLFAGTADGRVARSNDGGATWTASTSDVGNHVVQIRLSPNFATDNTLAVVALSPSNILQVSLSTDGGATLTQVGDGSTVWGSGTGALPGAAAIGGIYGQITFSPDFATDNFLFFAPAGTATSEATRRKDVKATANWASIQATNGVDNPAAVVGAIATPGIGDGVYLVLLSGDVQTATTGVARTFYPKTASESNAYKQYLFSDFDGVRDFGRQNGGRIFKHTDNTIRYIAADTAGAIREIRSFTDTVRFLTPAVPTAPPDGGTVPTNSGQNGQPILLSWPSVDRVWEWDIQIALDASFDSPVVDTSQLAIDVGAGYGNPATTSVYNIPANNLADGITYYWRVRPKEGGSEDADNIRHEGPWSATRSFTVGSTGAPSSPQASLPLDGAQLPGLSTQLSWNNPAGTTQIHIQVTPLNGDGPAINLIQNVTNIYNVPAPVFGTGPYVMLPGASYTWRVRTINITTVATEADTRWGPYSAPRTFTTAAPNSGTIQQLAPINGASTTDTTPTLQWKDANSAMFYYEVQLSADPNFGEAGAVAAVQWQLRHGGQSTPANSYTVPDSAALTKGTFYWRLRHRLQATAKGSAETGVAFTPAQMFVVN